MIEFGVKDIHYITLVPIRHEKVYVPVGFEFDGVTVKAPFTFLFSNRDLRKGIKASCLHDFMCKTKQCWDRKYATNVLVDEWCDAGLSKWKGFIVKICVNIYQAIKGGWNQC